MEMQTLQDTCRHWKTEVGSWKSRMMVSYKDLSNTSHSLHFNITVHLAYDAIAALLFHGSASLCSDSNKGLKTSAECIGSRFIMVVNLH